MFFLKCQIFLMNYKWLNQDVKGLLKQQRRKKSPKLYDWLAAATQLFFTSSEYELTFPCHLDW